MRTSFFMCRDYSDSPGLLKQSQDTATIASMSGPTIASVRRIWDRAAHCAFTDLARFRRKWYCVFREASGHAGRPGKVRVLASVDGAVWQSAALLSERGVDLRDPKLSIAADGRLMLLMGGTAVSAAGRQPRVSFSADGRAVDHPPPGPLGRGLAVARDVVPVPRVRHFLQGREQAAVDRRPVRKRGWPRLQEGLQAPGSRSAERGHPPLRP